MHVFCAAVYTVSRWTITIHVISKKEVFFYAGVAADQFEGNTVKECTAACPGRFPVEKFKLSHIAGSRSRLVRFYGKWTGTLVNIKTFFWNKPDQFCITAVVIASTDQAFSGCGMPQLHFWSEVFLRYLVFLCSLVPVLLIFSLSFIPFMGWKWTGQSTFGKMLCSFTVHEHMHIITQVYIRLKSCLH